MRFTVTKKITISFAIILFIGALSLLIVYNGLKNVKIAMNELADVKEPLNTAVNEMEINMHEISMSVLMYLGTNDTRYRKRVEEDIDDFKKFHDQYFKLVENQKSRDLGGELDILYRDFEILGVELMDKKDKQETILSIIAQNFEYMDDILDNKLQLVIDRESLEGVRKLAESADLEADIAEIGIWLANYQRIHKDEYKQLIFDNEKEFRRGLEQFKNLNLTEEERHWIQALEEILNQIMPLIQEVIKLEDYLQALNRQFIALRSEMDDILDEEIGPLIRHDLYTPRKAADQATVHVLYTIQFLIPLFVLSALGAAFLVIRFITKPVRRLMEGTEAISSGDLSYRIVPRGSDEFGDLAQHFNQMVAQLEATTVSKALLEASEAKLQETVVDLRREIAERRRAQEEQARLQASLRRSETMAAMGSLVAGVAHEVRNPLFGISSTLDAFEARFGAQDDYQRYLRVLRGELDRLTELMQELLEYGRPPSLELSPGRIEDVIGEAVRACAPLVGRLNVEIANHIRGGFPPVLMDQRRLLQVFQNLIENAIQHSPPGGIVSVEAREIRADDNAWIACMIEDAGSGFQAEDLPRIFEPFFTRRRGGTGLGLSIVQRIVEEHRGIIVASNRPEGGAVMTVRLPRAEL